MVGKLGQCSPALEEDGACWSEAEDWEDLVLTSGARKPLKGLPEVLQGEGRVLASLCSWLLVTSHDADGLIWIWHCRWALDTHVLFLLWSGSPVYCLFFPHP